MNELRQFELVLEIARSGSISGAAKVLKISQPTLSKYLANLESKLEIELFDRTTIPIKLTKAGMKYVSAGIKILDTYRQLGKEISDIKSEADVQIRIGIGPSRARYFIPKLISEFRKRDKHTKIGISELTTSQLNSALLRGELDFIISFSYDGTRQFEKVPLFSEKMVLAIPKKYRDYDTLSILKECPFVNTGYGLKMSSVLTNILSDVGAKKPIVEVQSIELAMTLAENGLGAAFVPSYMEAYGDFRNVFFAELPDEVGSAFKNGINREVCIFYRNEQFVSSTDKLFIEVCRGL